MKHLPPFAAPATLLAGLVLASLGLAGCADKTPGGLAVHARHEHFEELGDAFKAVNDELKSKTPNLGEVSAGADRVALLAPQITGWFPAGSGPQDGKRTDAKAEVWTQPGEFRQAAARLGDAANALKATIATGDVAAIGASAKTVGAACKGCHEKFKKD